jgi:hypothetical protein
MDFGGNTAEEVVLLDTGNAVPLAGGGYIQLNQANGLLYDVRQYSSYYLRLWPQVSPGPATMFNPILVQPGWIGGPTFASNQIYTDTYEFWADNLAGGTYGFTGSDLYFQDVQHGPYLYVGILNMGADAVAVDYDLYASTRPFPGPFGVQQLYSDNFLVSPTLGTIVALGAGATKQVAANFGYGRVRWRLSTTQAFVVNVTAGSYVPPFDSATAGAGTVEKEIIAPKRSLKFSITNSGGAPMNAFLNAVELADRQ